MTWTEIHLDTMRGLAALVVALGHARGLFFVSFTGAGTASSNGVAQQATSSTGQLTIGHEAVIVFFVLSGYLVGGSVMKALSAGSWVWTNYLIKRVVRLWIVLVPAIFIGILIDTIGFQFLAQNGSIYSAPAGQDYVKTEFYDQGHDVLIILGNIFFLQNIFVPTVGTNIALWSLSNEFWYYLLFPMVLLTLQPNARLFRRIAYGLSAFGIAVLIGVHADYLFLTWILGAAMSSLPRRIPPHLARWALLIVVTVFVVVFITAKRYNLPLYAGEMIIASSSGLLIYVIKCQNTIGKLSLYSQVSRFLSNISYTLYLTHLPFLILVCAVVNTPWRIATMSPTAIVKFLAVAAIVVAWSSGVYYLFEANTDTARAAVFALIPKLGVSAVKTEAYRNQQNGRTHMSSLRFRGRIPPRTVAHLTAAISHRVDHGPDTHDK